MSNDRSPHHSAIGPGLPPVPIRVLELEAERDHLIELLHRWSWMWNEGEIDREPLQVSQQDIDNLVRETREVLNARP
jgi:hypothetical protein